MIYVCVVAQSHADTVGLLLWKVRQVLSAERGEYHLLVADDGSSDGTRECLDQYARVLPMTVIRHEEPVGDAAATEELLRSAVEWSDRPKRDAAATLPADFSVSPAVLPELLKRFASGADVAVVEDLDTQRPLGERLLRRCAPWLLRPGLSLPGIRDLTSGAALFRLSTLKRCFQERDRLLEEREAACAWAELVARAAAEARQIAAVPLQVPRLPVARRPGHDPLATAVHLFRAGRRLRIPAPGATVQRA